MIDYNANNKWYDPYGFETIFKLHGSVFPQSMLQAVPAATLAAIIHRLGLNDPDSETGTVKEAWFGFQFALGFLTVFRTQLAYSRYWEGASLMGRIRGQWFNATSNLFAFCSSSEAKAADVETFQQYLVRLVSMLHCAALQQVSDLEDERFEILNVAGIDNAGLKFLDENPVERPFILLQWIQRLVMDNHANGVLTAPPPILSRVFQEYGQGIVNIQDAEKLTTVKFPFPYAQMLSFMLWLSAVVSPFMAGILIDQWYWAVAFTFLSCFALFSINNIAKEIELPFGDDTNDLPVRELQIYLNKILNMLLHRQTQIPPSFAFNQEMKNTPAETLTMNHEGQFSTILEYNKLGAAAAIGAK